MNENMPERQPAAHPLPSLKMIGDKLTGLVRVADDVWKLFRLGYVIFIALGLLLVWRFTTAALVPLEVDVSTALFLLAVTALAFAVFLIVFWAALMPVLIVTEFPGFLTVLENRGWRDWRRCLAHYGTVFLPYLVWALSWSLTLWIGIIIRPSLAINPTVLGIFSFGGITFLVSVLFAIVALFFSARIWRRLTGVAGRDQLVGLFAVTCISCIWLLAVSMFAIPVASRLGFIPLNPSDAWAFTVVLVVMGWHFMTVFAYMLGGYRAAVLLGAFVLASTILFLPVGAATSRLLGIGGGIPISATVRIYEDTSGAPQIRRIQGCLVMWLGSQVSIQFPRDENWQISHCHFSPFTPVEEAGASVPTEVHTLARSDILDIYSLGRKVRP